ncbi:MAG TPA: transglycosylase domain-containing protein [Chitinophagaceae bacterium]
MKKILGILFIVFLSGLGIFALVVFLVTQGVFGPLPSVQQMENPNLMQASEVLAADGTLMGKYYRVGGNRSNVDFKDISPNVINALIATEDERFYQHSGIDVKATMRAIFLLGKAGGGSTITQQLALNLFGERRSSNRASRLIQKIKEYIIARKLEERFNKQQILTLYLNTVPFGDNVYGIRIAARTFFQKEPSELKTQEAAVLVGMLKGNSMYNPRLHPEASKGRRNVVLGQMEKRAMLTPAEAARLKALPLKINYKKLDENNGTAPYLREVLRDELKEALDDLEKPGGGRYSLYEDGLRIHTTINPQMQAYAEESVAQQMPVLQKSLNRQRNIRTGSVWKGREKVLEAAMKASDRWRNMEEEGLEDADIRKSFKRKVPMKVFAWNAKREKDTVMTPMDSIKYHRQMLQTAFMVMDPHTGAVKAWVGGINYKTYKFDHASLKTKRQVGSTIKPLLYAQAVEELGYIGETQILDQQQDFGGGRMVPATTNSCRGDTISLSSALTWSRNCATAYLMKQIGPEQFTKFLERISIPTEVDAHPAIALGSCDLSLYEMMWSYTIFPGAGVSTEPYIISRIEDRYGNVLKRFDAGKGRKEVISDVTAYRMHEMMQRVVTEGTAKGLRDRLGATEMGGKTGTTNDNADAWFMGYTPQLLAGSWIGCDDRFIRIESGLGYGGQAARPIWEAFFRKVYANGKLGIDRDAIIKKPEALKINTDSLVLQELMDAGLLGTEEEQPPMQDNGDEYYNPGWQDPSDEGVKPATPAQKGKTVPPKKTTNAPAPKIGEAAPAPKEEKKGIFKKIFGKKEE